MAAPKAAAGKTHCWRASAITTARPLEPIFEPVIEKAGFRLVRLRLTGAARRRLQVMAERPDGRMDVAGCAELTHVLLDFLETQDPISGDYEIEVSSPGIDRPLTRLSDFTRWKGHEAKIALSAALDGRRRLKGRLEGLDGEDVVLSEGGTRLQFPFRLVEEAKLILTDKLIAEDLKAHKSA